MRSVTLGAGIEVTEANRTGPTKFYFRATVLLRHAFTDAFKSSLLDINREHSNTQMENPVIYFLGGMNSVNR